jgi:hypothetical protein
MSEPKPKTNRERYAEVEASLNSGIFSSEDARFLMHRIRQLEARSRRHSRILAEVRRLNTEVRFWKLGCEIKTMLLRKTASDYDALRVRVGKAP